jgi:hypothetical protein
MSAKQVTTSSSILTETVGTYLNITRQVQGGGQPGLLPGVQSEVPTVAFSVQAAYADHEYLVDAEGNKLRLLASNRNQRHISIFGDDATAFYMTPMKLMDGTTTCLGEFLSDLWDAAIVADLAKPTPNPLP